MYGRRYQRKRGFKRVVVTLLSLVMLVSVCFPGLRASAEEDKITVPLGEKTDYVIDLSNASGIEVSPSEGAPAFTPSEDRQKIEINAESAVVGTYTVTVSFDSGETGVASENKVFTVIVEEKQAERSVSAKNFDSQIEVLKEKIDSFDKKQETKTALYEDVQALAEAINNSTEITDEERYALQAQIVTLEQEIEALTVDTDLYSRLMAALTGQDMLDLMNEDVDGCYALTLNELSDLQDKVSKMDADDALEMVQENLEYLETIKSGCNCGATDGNHLPSCPEYKPVTYAGELSTITDVESFYDASGKSGNGNSEVVAVYYDKSGNLHIIVAAISSTADNLAKHTTEWVSIGNITERTDFSSTVLASTITITVSGNEIPKTLSNGNGFVDFNLGQGIIISNNFNLTIKAKTGGDSESNSWNISGNFKVELEYSLTKLVSTDGSNFFDKVKVEPGQTVIYKITIQNSKDSDVSINAATLIDELPTSPTNPFDMQTVEYSTDAENWTSASGTLITLNGNLTVNRGDTVTYYIKATVKSDLEINDTQTFTNTAKISGSQIVGQESTADITIDPPKTGDLIITKNIVGDVSIEKNVIFNMIVAHGSDVDKDAFAKWAEDNSYNLEKDVIIVPVVVKVGNTSGSITLKGLPLGTYTVVEELTDEVKMIGDYDLDTTTYQPENGEDKNGSSVNLNAENRELTVTVINSYVKATTTVTVKKTVSGNMGDWSKEFKFNATVDNGEIISVNGDGCTVSADKKSAEFYLHHDEEITFTVPVGTTFAVQETEHANYDVYINGSTEKSPDAKASVEKIDRNGTTITYKNNNNASIDTGITTDSIPYILLFSLAVIGAGILLLNKRRDTGKF